MTKEQYVALVRHEAGRLDKTMRFRETVVEAAMNGCYNTLLCSMYEQKAFSLDIYLTMYENQSVIGKKVALPAVCVPLDRVGGGVVTIRPSEDVDVLFFPMREEQAKRHGYSEYASLTRDVGFVVKGNGIEFIGELGGITTVDIGLVRALESYGWEEHILMPKGYDSEIIRMTLQELGVIQRESLLNNNSDELTDRG